MNMGQHKVLDLVTQGLRDSRENIGKYGGFRNRTFMGKASGNKATDDTTKGLAIRFGTVEHTYFDRAIQPLRLTTNGTFGIGLQSTSGRWMLRGKSRFVGLATLWRVGLSTLTLEVQDDPFQVGESRGLIPPLHLSID
jgi:hypothetical protein